MADFALRLCLRVGAMAVDLKVSRIKRHLAVGPSFGGQTAAAGGTPHTRAICLPFDGLSTKVPIRQLGLSVRVKL